MQVVNLAHLAHLINNSTERYTKLELEWNKVGSQAIIIITPTEAVFAYMAKNLVAWLSFD